MEITEKQHFAMHHTERPKHSHHQRVAFKKCEINGIPYCLYGIVKKIYKVDDSVYYDIYVPEGNKLFTNVPELEMFNPCKLWE
jgi:hypothetical protein